MPFSLPLGYSQCAVELSADLAEREEADGIYHAAPGSSEGTMQIDDRLRGLRFIHAVVHEWVHHWEQYTGRSLSESTVDSLSASFVEGFFASGLIDVAEFETRLRTLVADPQ